ncbi:MAG: metalloregulator ArsR/SmtB family transcription factor [Bacteroidetes bacterium]|nr:metalloregulator ArsR/SmtB family transcription factor [Bacteroidota bacterium]MCL6097027.1 metalloregulator ArsR/SmtB family transcription factor [Bacteroidota bacterium]
MNILVMGDMTGREFKDLTFQQFANIATAFASPKRLELIDILSQGERDVDTLSFETNMNFANTSRHLQILKNSKIVVSRKEGVRVVYSLANEEVIKCWKGLQTLAEKSASEIRETARLFFEERSALIPISSTELLDKLNKDEVTLIDVRPKEEFLSGHLPEAISIPLKELKEKLNNLPTHKEVVAYCRGPYCVLAAEAAKLLTQKGFNVVILKEDVNSWRSEGLPIQN